MQANGFADQIGHQKITLQHLPDHENADHGADPAGRIPELKQRKPDRQCAADDRPDIGDKRYHPGHRPDHQPELQPHQHQTGGIVYCQNAANRQLTAHKARHCLVNFGGKAADGGRVIAGQPTIYLGGKSIPVQQHVEGHHRHHDHEHHRVDDPEGRAEQAVDQLAAALLNRGAQFRDGLAHGALRIHQIRELFGKKGLQLGEDARRGINQRGTLLDQHRNDDQRCQHKAQTCGNADDRCSRNPAEPGGFQPVCHRVEEIGDGPADQKRQDHIAQQV